MPRGTAVRRFKDWTRLPLAAACALAVLAIGAPSAGAFERTWIGPFRQPGQLAISSDGGSVYVSDAETTLALRRNAATGALSLIDSYDGGGDQMALSTDGTSLYVLTDLDQAITQFRRNADGSLTEAGVWRMPEFGQITDIATPNPTTVYALDLYGGVVRILDRNPATGALSPRTTVSGEPGGLGHTGSMEVSPDRNWLYVADDSGAIAGYHVAADGGLTAASPCTCSGYGDLAFTPAGDRLFSGPAGPDVYDRDTTTGALTQVGSSYFTFGGRRDGWLAVSADGKSLFAPDDGLVQYASGADGLTVAHRYHPGRDGLGIAAMRALAVSPDGRDLYVSGGGYRYPGTVADYRVDPDSGELTYSSIFTGPIYDGGPPRQDDDAPTITIDGGAEYTNTPHVQVTLANVGQPFWIEVSNDGGFGAEVFKSPDEVSFPWTLNSTGPERLPKWVYIRTLSADPRFSGHTYADDIILDERPPAVDSAQLVSPPLRAASARQTVRLKAHDDVSGVSRMQFRRGRATSAAWRAFRALASMPARKGKLYVRVRDGARNVSKWRVVTG